MNATCFLCIFFYVSLSVVGFEFFVRFFALPGWGIGWSSWWWRHQLFECFSASVCPNGWNADGFGKKHLAYFIFIGLYIQLLCPDSCTIITAPLYLELYFSEFCTFSLLWEQISTLASLSLVALFVFSVPFSPLVLFLAFTFFFLEHDQTM